MKDIIYREDAIRVVEEALQNIFVEPKGLGEKIINPLPSAERTGWIPCNKKLPKESEQVLIYLFGDSPYIAWYERGTWRTNDFDIDKDENPIAWMPLPKPYEEG